MAQTPRARARTRTRARDRDPSLVTDAGESLRAVAAQIDLRRVRDETSNSDPAAVAAAIETVQASASTAQRLFVSGLYADATEASVREILSLYGDVVECKMLPASMMERAARGWRSPGGAPGQPRIGPGPTPKRTMS